MLHSHDAILLILGYFIIVVVVLAIFWRISVALDLVATRMHEIAEELRKLSAYWQSRDRDPK